MNLKFEYSHSIDDKVLDGLGEKELWDTANDAAMQYRSLLLHFWGTATPHRRAETAKKGVGQ